MDSSQNIRDALARVAELRRQAVQPALAPAANAVKRLQARRFAGTYPDLLADPKYAPSALFFLEELYGARDYSERDAQFSRIAGALERTFPEAAVATVVSLAQLHRQTEELDLALAQAWVERPGQDEAARYLAAWRVVGARVARDWQLATVIDIGQSLGRLTRKPGLRLMLKMMRQPARLAGLSSLQGFLELGFDHFAGLTRSPDGVATFLGTIHARESAWLGRLFDAPAADCEAELTRTLALAPAPGNNP